MRDLWQAVWFDSFSYTSLRPAANQVEIHVLNIYKLLIMCIYLKAEKINKVRSLASEELKPRRKKALTNYYKTERDGWIVGDFYSFCLVISSEIPNRLVLK